MVDIQSGNLNLYSNRDLSKVPKLNRNTQPLDNQRIKNVGSDTFEYSKDDGVISTEEKIKNLGKGVVKPVTEMFSSKENFLMGAGMIVGCTMLTIATGGAALPFLVATGAAMGAGELIQGACAASNAQTDKEAIEAWQSIGEGASISALSVAGAKPSLKSAGVNTDGLNPLTATVKCFKESKNSFLNSIKAFATGEYRTNLGLKPKWKETVTERYVSEDEVPDWAKAGVKEETKAPQQPENEASPLEKLQGESPKLLNEQKQKSILKGKSIETLKQEYADAKTKFVEEHRQNIPSYKERYQEILDLTGDHNWAKVMSEEGAYLDYKFSLTPKSKELKLSIKLKSLNEQELINFNKAKAILDEKNIQYDEYMLACSDSIISDISSGVFSKDNFVIGHNYAKILNPYLRNGSLNEGNLYKTFLDEGFKSVNPLSEEITVYKKVNKNALNLQEDEIVTDKGYSSSNISKKSVSKADNNGGCIATIKVPKGARVSYNTSGKQSEFLFPRNAQFKVVKPYNSQTGEIELEYVLPQE